MDPIVKSAIAHWAAALRRERRGAHRFRGGDGLGRRWDDWCRAWSDRAAVHEAMGREALAAKQFISAGEHLQRAGVYYHFGKFLFVHDMPQMKAAHMKAVECRNAALPHLNPPGERVDDPVRGQGALRHPAQARRRVAKPPVLIMAVGLDSAKEETDAYEQPFLERGIGDAGVRRPRPGRGRVRFRDPRRLRGGREGAWSTTSRRARDLDTARIGLWGVSLGGYYAPRAAAFEKRIKACIALGGPYDWARALGRPAGTDARAFRVRSHCATDAGAQAPRADPVAEGRGAAHHLSDFRR